MLTFGAIARTRFASGRLVTKKILQPDLDNALAIGSMPQPYAFPLTTLAHSASVYLLSHSQLDAMAVRFIFRTPQASASGGPSTVTQATRPLLLTTRLPPLLMILPSTDPSTTTVAPGSIVKLPRIVASNRSSVPANIFRTLRVLSGS